MIIVKELRVTIDLEEKFLRHCMVALGGEDLKSRVSELENALNRILDNARGDEDEDVFSTGMDRQLVDALNRSGHALWSWGHDGENVERWSYDYTTNEMRSLVLDIHRCWKVRCDWIERDPRSGHRSYITGVCDPGFDQDKWSELRL